MTSTTTVRRRTPSGRLRAALAALVLVAGLAACADGTSSGTGGHAMDGTSMPMGDDDPASSSDAVPAHGAADTTFAQLVVEHHRGAVAMADLAAARSSDPAVLDLARAIAAAQGPEIETMTGWLEAWGEEPTHDDDDMPGMDMDGMDMGGRSQDEVMAELEPLTGTAFDQAFLTRMVEHHEGAVEMARTELADGQFPDALALAQEVVDTQTAEIATMRDLLAGLS